jgi:hypothetical protein
MKPSFGLLTFWKKFIDSHPSPVYGGWLLGADC